RPQNFLVEIGKKRLGSNKGPLILGDPMNLEIPDRRDLHLSPPDLSPASLRRGTARVDRDGPRCRRFAAGFRGCSVSGRAAIVGAPSATALPKAVLATRNSPIPTSHPPHRALSAGSGLAAPANKKPVT